MNLAETIAAARVSGPAGAGPDSVVFEFRFDAAHPVFAGHFPGHPLLPGIFQLEMARLGAEWITHRPWRLREIGKAKFQRPLLPDELVRMELQWSESGGTVKARVRFSVTGQPAGEAAILLCENK